MEIPTVVLDNEKTSSKTKEFQMFTLSGIQDDKTLPLKIENTKCLFWLWVMTPQNISA